jgi:membrane-bound lytic murein transglycosylase D
MKLRYSLVTAFTLVLIGACSHLPSKVSQPQNSTLSEPSLIPPEPIQFPADTIILTEEDDSEPGVKDEPTEEEATPEGSEEATTSFENSGSDLNGDVPSGKMTQTELDDALELCQVSQEYWQKGELENALDALDRAYALILSANTTQDPKLTQQKEDLRFMISKRILEIYASRNIVANGHNNAIPVVINRYVQAEIDLFTKGDERQFFIEAYRRSGKYRPQIVAALEESGLPKELSWLPLIESGYKVNALSRSRALGLWQFIPSTGYKFGLNRDKFVDERMDPAKSTKAAIEYLKELHQIFGDWSTVLAAYNCGEGRVLTVIRNQNINYLDNFWDLYERLPRETARYVPRFLATLHILNNPGTYGLDPISVDLPLDFETVVVNRQVHLKQIANAIGVEEDKLTELNPELRHRLLPGDNYQLRVPRDSRELLLASIDQLPVAHLPQRAIIYHRVQPGESLSAIARKYHTNVASIKRANNMYRSNYIVAGKSLKIPQKGYIHAAPEVPKTAKDQSLTHLVRKGDSLYNIAKRYGTTTKKIQELNSLQSTLLHEGQLLQIFAGLKPLPAVGELSTYEVQPGDTPVYIAKRHNMELDRLLHLNRLYPGSKIYPGQKLYIE